jgi:acyl carrier protein
MSVTRDQIQEYILNKLVELSKDWDDQNEIGPGSLIFTELGYESLDAVVLGVAIQEHFGRQMPFAELFAELGKHQRDLSVSELVDFVYGNLNPSVAESPRASQAL